MPDLIKKRQELTDTGTGNVSAASSVEISIPDKSNLQVTGGIHPDLPASSTSANKNNNFNLFDDNKTGVTVSGSKPSSGEPVIDESSWGEVSSSEEYTTGLDYGLDSQVSETPEEKDQTRYTPSVVDTGTEETEEESNLTDVNIELGRHNVDFALDPSFGQTYYGTKEQDEDGNEYFDYGEAKWWKHNAEEFNSLVDALENTQFQTAEEIQGLEQLAANLHFDYNEMGEWLDNNVAQRKLVLDTGKCEDEAIQKEWNLAVNVFGSDKVKEYWNAQIEYYEGFAAEAYDMSDRSKLAYDAFVSRNAYLSQVDDDKFFGTAETNPNYRDYFQNVSGGKLPSELKAEIDLIQRQLDTWAEQDRARKDGVNNPYAGYITDPSQLDGYYDRGEYVEPSAKEQNDAILALDTLTKQYEAATEIEGYLQNHDADLEIWRDYYLYPDEDFDIDKEIASLQGDANDASDPEGMAIAQRKINYLNDLRDSETEKQFMDQWKEADTKSIEDRVFELTFGAVDEEKVEAAYDEVKQEFSTDKADVSETLTEINAEYDKLYDMLINHDYTVPSNNPLASQSDKMQYDELLARLAALDERRAELEETGGSAKAEEPGKIKSPSIFNLPALPEERTLEGDDKIEMAVLQRLLQRRRQDEQMARWDSMKEQYPENPAAHWVEQARALNKEAAEQLAVFRGNGSGYDEAIHDLQRENGQLRYGDMFHWIVDKIGGYSFENEEDAEKAASTLESYLDTDELSLDEKRLIQNAVVDLNSNGALRYGEFYDRIVEAIGGTSVDPRDEEAFSRAITGLENRKNKAEEAAYDNYYATRDELATALSFRASEVASYEDYDEMVAAGKARFANVEGDAALPIDALRTASGVLNSTGNTSQARRILIDAGFTSDEADDIVPLLSAVGADPLTPDYDKATGSKPSLFDSLADALSGAWKKVTEEPFSYNVERGVFTETQTDYFYYLLEKEGIAEAMKYAAGINSDLNAEYREMLNRNYQIVDNYNAAHDSKGGALMQGLATPWVSSLGAMTAIVDTVNILKQQAVLGQAYTPESMSFADLGQRLDETAMRHLQTQYGHEELVNFLYGAYSSSVRSLETAWLTGGLADFVGISDAATITFGGKTWGARELFSTLCSDVTFFGSATAETYNNLLAGGVDSSTATAVAIRSGIWEALFEHVSFDKFYNAKNVADWGEGLSAAKNWLMTSLAQAGIEGSEEIFTEMANNLTEDRLLGMQSTYEDKVRSYQKMYRMPREEAAKYAQRDMAMDLAITGASGFVSGAFGAGARSATSYMQENSAETKEYRAAVGKQYTQVSQDGKTAAQMVAEYLDRRTFIRPGDEGNFTESAQALVGEIKKTAAEVAKGNASDELVGRMISLVDAYDSSIINNFALENKDVFFVVQPGRLAVAYQEQQEKLLGKENAQKYAEIVRANPDKRVLSTFASGLKEVAGDSVSIDTAEKAGKMLEMILYGNDLITEDQIKEALQSKELSDPAVQKYVLQYLGDEMRRALATPTGEDGKATIPTKGNLDARQAFGPIVAAANMNLDAKDTAKALETILTDLWNKAKDAAYNYSMQWQATLKSFADTMVRMEKDTVEQEGTTDAQAPGKPKFSAEYRDDGDTITENGKTVTRKEYVESMMKGINPFTGAKEPIVNGVSEENFNTEFDNKLMAYANDSNEEVSAAMVKYDLGTGQAVGSQDNVLRRRVGDQTYSIVEEDGKFVVTDSDGNKVGTTKSYGQAFALIDKKAKSEKPAVIPPAETKTGEVQVDNTLEKSGEPTVIPPAGTTVQEELNKRQQPPEGKEGEHKVESSLSAVDNRPAETPEEPKVIPQSGRKTVVEGLDYKNYEFSVQKEGNKFYAVDSEGNRLGEGKSYGSLLDSVMHYVDQRKPGQRFALTNEEPTAPDTVTGTTEVTGASSGISVTGEKPQDKTPKAYPDYTAKQVQSMYIQATRDGGPPTQTRTWGDKIQNEDGVEVTRDEFVARMMNGQNAFTGEKSEGTRMSATAALDLFDSLMAVEQNNQFVNTVAETVEEAETEEEAKTPEKAKAPAATTAQATTDTVGFVASTETVSTVTEPKSKKTSQGKKSTKAKATVTAQQVAEKAQEVTALETASEQETDEAKLTQLEAARDNARKELETLLHTNLTEVGAAVSTELADIRAKLKSVRGKAESLEKRIKSGATNGIKESQSQMAQLAAYRDEAKALEERRDRIKTVQASYKSAEKELNNLRNRMGGTAQRRAAKAASDTKGVKVNGPVTTSSNTAQRADSVGNAGAGAASVGGSRVGVQGNGTASAESNKGAPGSITEGLSKHGITLEDGETVFDSKGLSLEDIEKMDGLTSAEKDMISRLIRNGVGRVAIVNGKLWNGKYYASGNKQYARGDVYQEDGKTTIVVSNATQHRADMIMAHEFVHHMLSAMTDDQRRHFLSLAMELIFSQNEALYDKVSEFYRDKYSLAYGRNIDGELLIDDELMDAVHEEILADFYGGIFDFCDPGTNKDLNRFARDMNNTVRQYFEMSGLETFSESKYNGTDRLPKDTLDVSYFKARTGSAFGRNYTLTPEQQEKLRASRRQAAQVKSSLSDLFNRHSLATAEDWQAKASEEDLKVVNAAVEKFGTTKNFMRAGFVLPNGEMLDFTDDFIRQAAVMFSPDDPDAAGFKNVDHAGGAREVLNGLGIDAKDPIDDFNNRGMVRISYADNVIQVAAGKGITAEQAKTLEDFIDFIKRDQSKENKKIEVEIKDSVAVSSINEEYSPDDKAVSIVNDLAFASQSGYFLGTHRQILASDEPRYTSAGGRFERFSLADTETESKYSLSDAQHNEFAPVFYSKMQNVIEDWTANSGKKMPERMGAGSVVSWLKGKGVKDEEIKWSGIVPYLEGKKSVSRDELLQVMAENQFEIETVLLTRDRPAAYVDVETGTTYADKRELDFTAAFYAETLGFDGSTLEDQWQDGELTYYALDPSDGIMTEVLTVRAVQNATELPSGIDRIIQETTWGEYVLPGGKNYREVLFRHPDLGYSNRAMRTHWSDVGSESDVLAHARIDDMKAKDGSSVLFVEEIQSDLHNAGGQSGFNQPLTAKEKAQLQRHDELEKKANDLYNRLYDDEELNAQLRGVYDKLRSLRLLINSRLGVKDRVGWNLDSWLHSDDWPLVRIETPSAEQNEIIYQFLTDEEKETLASFRGIYEEYKAAEREADNAPIPVQATNAPPDVPFAGSSDTYHEYVMKHLLRMAAEGGYDKIGWTTAQQQSDRWSDDYAEGYRIEYDQNIPKFMRKYGKPWGATVGSTVLENGEEVWSVDITPQMKEDVLYEGQARFSLADTETVTLDELQTARDEMLDLRQQLRDRKADVDEWSRRIMAGEAEIDDYNKWLSDSGYNRLYMQEREASKRYNDLNRAYDEQQERANAEAEQNAIEQSGLSEADYFGKEAVKVFGYTPYFYDAGYITPNGRMLNFSGEKGKHYGSRGQDHRSIGQIFATTSGTEAMNRFINYGNIRIMAEAPGLDISANIEPTAGQYSRIRDFARSARNEDYFTIDITGEDGRVIDTIEYESVNPTKIVNDLKNYYRTGEVPQQSITEQFHSRFSLVPVEPIQPSSGAWSRTIDSVEAKERFPNLWDVTADESESRNPTQIQGTVSTYRKIYNILRDEGFDGTILDASSGLGYGTRAGIEEYGFDVEDIEPYPDKNYNPKYTDYSTLDKTYDAIISNAVLNVLPQDLRDSLVVKMGQLLNPGGRMFINVRSANDVKQLTKNASNTAIGNGDYYVASSGSYQKGFTKPELKAYLEDALGPDYTVDITNKFGDSAVIVTKSPYALDDRQTARFSITDDSNADGYTLSDIDSTGRELTDEQYHYFRNSKVVDEDGHLIPLYHGTNAFGFTEIDFDKADDGISFFLTDSPEVAGSYTRNNTVRSLFDKQRQRRAIDVSKPSDEDLASLFSQVSIPYFESATVSKYEDVLRTFTGPLNAAKRRYASFFEEELLPSREDLGLTETDLAFYDALKGNSTSVESITDLLDRADKFYYSLRKKIWDTDESYIWDEMRSLQPQLQTAASQAQKFLADHNSAGVSLEDNVFITDPGSKNFYTREQIERLTSRRQEEEELGRNSAGIYKGYANLTNPFIVDANGAEWNQIPVDQEVVDYLKALNSPEFYVSEWAEDGEVKTRGIAKYAKDHGYDGAIIRNCVDIGEYKRSYDYEAYSTPATLVLCFEQNQFKDYRNTEPTDGIDLRFSIADTYDAFGDEIDVQDGTVLNATKSTLSDQLFYSEDGNTAYYQLDSGETVVINGIGENSPEARYINYLEAMNNANSSDTTTTKPYTIPPATRNASDGYNLGESNDGLRRGAEEVPAQDQEGAFRRTGSDGERNEQSQPQGEEQEGVKYSLMPDITRTPFINEKGDVVTTAETYPIGSFERSFIEAYDSNNIDSFKKQLVDMMNGETIPPEVVSLLDQIVQEHPAMTKQEKEAMYKIIEDLRDEFGTMASAKNPKNDVHLPKGKTEGTRIMKNIQTSAQNAETEWLREQEMYEAITNDILSYTPTSNKDALAQAEDYIKSKNYDFDVLANDFHAWLESGTAPKPWQIAVGERLLAMCEENGRAKDAMTVVIDLALMAHQTGQALQAFNILRKCTPRGQLYYLQGVIDALNKQYDQAIRSGKMPGKITMPKDAWDRVTACQTRQELDDAIDEIKQQIADQIPVSWADRWNAWRYLAMLGNPRTHVRNVFGNALFSPAVFIKDMISRRLEEKYDKKGRLEGRSRVAGAKLGANTEWMKYAEQDFEVMRKIITGEAKGNKYSDVSEILGMRDLWGKDKWLGGKILSWLDDLNSMGLEKEDAMFLKRYYTRAFAEYLQANGVTEAQLRDKDFGAKPENRKLISKARAWATLEAQRNTYRDANVVAQTINQLKRRSGAAYVLLEGMVPFTKTPLNILYRGIEYSPIGLVQSIVQLRKDLANGQMTTSQSLDRLAAGMTGSGIMLLGLLLSHLGVLRGDDPDKEKERMFESLQGHQAWSVELFGRSYTIDWMAPAALPLFIGSSVYDMLTRERGDFSLEDFAKACIGIANPLSSLSMLDGISSMFQDMSQSQDAEWFGVILSSMLTSYISQGMPTFFGQVARSIDPDQRRTFIQAESANPAFQRFIQKSIQSKVPGWESKKMAYVDEWGRKDSADTVGEKLWKAIENFFSPGYGNMINTTPVDAEIQRLYDTLKDDDVLPGVTQKSFSIGEEGAKNMTADEYERYRTERGQIAYGLIEQMINTEYYASLNDAEKGQKIKEIYSLADNLAKQDIAPEYSLESKWMEQAKNIGLLDYMLIKDDLNMNRTHEQLFTYLASNPDLTPDQVTQLVADEYSAPDKIASQMYDGYNYNISQADEEMMTMIFEEELKKGFARLENDPKYTEADPFKQGSMTDHMYQEAQANTKIRYAEMLDQQGRAKEVGSSTGLGNDKFMRALGLTAAELNTNLGEGNIDLNSRDTENTTVYMDGKYYVLPSAGLTDEEAVEQFEKTGEYFGIFDSKAQASSYGRRIVKDQGDRIAKGWTPAADDIAAQAEWLGSGIKGDKTISNPERDGWNVVLDKDQSEERDERFRSAWNDRYREIVTSDEFNKLETQEDQGTYLKVQASVLMDQVNADYASELIGEGRAVEEIGKPRQGSNAELRNTFSIADESFDDIGDQAKWLAQLFNGETSVKVPDMPGYKVKLSENQKNQLGRNEQARWEDMYRQSFEGSNWTGKSDAEKNAFRQSLMETVEDIEQQNYYDYLIKNGFQFDVVVDVSGATNEAFWTAAFDGKHSNKEIHDFLEERYMAKVGTSILNNTLDRTQRLWRVETYMEYIEDNDVINKIMALPVEKRAAAFESYHKKAMDAGTGYVKAESGIRKTTEEADDARTSTPGWSVNPYLTTPLNTSTPIPVNGTKPVHFDSGNITQSNVTAPSITPMVIPPNTNTSTSRSGFDRAEKKDRRFYY